MIHFDTGITMILSRGNPSNYSNTVEIPGLNFVCFSIFHWGLGVYCSVHPEHIIILNVSVVVQSYSVGGFLLQYCTVYYCTGNQ